MSDKKKKSSRSPGYDDGGVPSYLHEGAVEDMVTRKMNRLKEEDKTAKVKRQAKEERDHVYARKEKSRRSEGHIEDMVSRKMNRLKEQDDMAKAKRHVREEQDHVYAQKTQSSPDGSPGTLSRRSSTEEPIAAMEPPPRPGYRNSRAGSNRYQEKMRQYDSPSNSFRSSEGSYRSPHSPPSPSSGRRRTYRDKMDEYNLTSSGTSATPGAVQASPSSSRRRSSAGVYREKMMKYQHDHPSSSSEQPTNSSSFSTPPTSRNSSEPRSARTSTPGAVSVSITNETQQELRKGRLTMHSSHEPPITDSVRQAIASNDDSPANSSFDPREDDFLDAAVTQSNHVVADANKERSWWCDTRFKILVALLLVAAIAVGVAVPLSSSSSGSSGSSGDSVTDAPTASPMEVEGRRELVLAQVSSISDPLLLAQVGSPQNLALEWIVTQDQLSPLEEDSGEDAIEKLLQRYALAVFFYSTGGETAWVVNRNWLGVDVDECEWRFVTCAAGQAISINTGTTGNGVTGELPGEIGVLSSMESLVLPMNTINLLPDELRNLTSLVALNLDDNEMEGSIPSVVFDLTSLESLILSQMSLTGTISPLVSNLSRLTFLDLFFNDLEGTLPLPSLQSLASLRGLSVGNNNLHGNFTELIIGLPGLVSLLIAFNNFSGGIPSEIGLMQNLGTLSADSNPLISTIPTEIGLTTKLEFLALATTGLTGNIPSEMGNLSSLRALLLTANILSGPIPPELCNLRTPNGALEEFIVGCELGCTCCTNSCEGS